MPHQTRPVVLQILPRLVTGGVERGTIDIALALQAAGGVPLVVSRGGPMVHELEQAGIEHLAMPVHSKNPLLMRANIDRLVHLMKERRVNIIHARSRAPAWSAWIAAHRTGASFLTTFHGTYTLGPLAMKKPYNAVMACGDLVIAISHFIAAHVQAVYGSAPERIRVVPRGVDCCQFDPISVHPSRLIALAKAWRLPENRPLIMLPGRLTRWKGHEILLEALAKLKRRDLCCLLVGFDQGRVHYRTQLETMIRHKGLDSMVRLVGDCADMPAAYMLADVVVSASTEPEAFGRVVVEAQAMGRPVVATDHGGSRETVVHGQTGWLIPPRNPDALAQALSALLALAPVERQALAVRQVAHTHAHFSKAIMCASTLSIYEDLLTGTTSSPESALVTREKV
ncbi:Glycosyltransferase [invertebrate metagenome]|uniref:Glycosyltransferase n=1 Tax=invertebrate metagenome TaxID=1711999 RepID=A0A484HBX6_9ZZZZ